MPQAGEQGERGGLQAAAIDRRSAVALVAVPLVAILVAAGAAMVIGRSASWFGPLIAALLVGMGGSAAGSLIVVLTGTYRPDYLPQGWLGGMAARLFATLIGVLAVGIALDGSAVFLISAVAFYLIGLAAETILAVRTARQCSFSG